MSETWNLYVKNGAQQTVKHPRIIPNTFTPRRSFAAEIAFGFLWRLLRYIRSFLKNLVSIWSWFEILPILVPFHLFIADCHYTSHRFRLSFLNRWFFFNRNRFGNLSFPLHIWSVCRPTDCSCHCCHWCVVLKNFLILHNVPLFYISLLIGFLFIFTFFFFDNCIVAIP